MKSSTIGHGHKPINRSKTTMYFFYACKTIEYNNVIELRSRTIYGVRSTTTCCVIIEAEDDLTLLCNNEKYYRMIHDVGSHSVIKKALIQHRVESRRQGGSPS